MKNATALFSILLLSASCNLRAADLGEAAGKALAAHPEARLSIPGEVEPWLFTVQELQHLTRTPAPEPVQIITEYAAALRELGVELILVPVPAKAAIYPEKLSAALPPPAADSSPLHPLPSGLAEIPGCRVLDLTSLYLARREIEPGDLLYCATDSHWSPLGAQLAAEAVAAMISDHSAVQAAPKIEFQLSEPAPLEFHGDLIAADQRATTAMETLPASIVSPGTSGDSPVLVMGDSHCQVFTKGGPMHATGAGFIDHLAAALSIPVEEISSQSSGADQPRGDVARRTAREPDFWDKRKVLIWLFTEREFTQGTWRKIPAQVRR
jgi:alginate O-acetyltransferase complex protein AlgJ